MNNIELESLDEALNYLNEGKFLDKIKRTISKIINKNLKNEKHPNTNKNKTTSSKQINNFKFEDMVCTLEKATNDILDQLATDDAYCAEGMSNCDKMETAEYFARYAYDNWENIGKHFSCYYCFGKDLNDHYHLTDDNAYPDNLGIFFIDWSFWPKFDAAKYKYKFRYFGDVVWNNARREKEKGNPYY